MKSRDFYVKPVFNRINFVGILKSIHRHEIVELFIGIINDWLKLGFFLLLLRKYFLVG